MKAVVVAIGAKQIHKTLAPWCLKAYAQQQAFGGEFVILEHTINELSEKIVASIYAQTPDLLGLSCYIWNIEMVRQVGAALRKLLPHCKIVLGGPEVSFESDCSAFPFADGIIIGAGEKAFYHILKNNGEMPGPIIIDSNPPAFADLPTPFTEDYFASLQDRQLVYYESTRGCPFRCAYCLSALSGGVETLPLERTLKEIKVFADKNLRCVKFVDRTFNYDKARAYGILEFVRELETETCFHFEVAPDLFDEPLLALLDTMPPGRVQFEMGIQSTNHETLAACSRKTNLEAAFKHIQRLSSANRIHIHVDLIAGLPYETLETFIPAIDRCLNAKPHAVQLGFLKLLKGSVLRRDQQKYGFTAFDEPPYELLETNTLPYRHMQRLKQVEEVLDKYYNSGMFARAVDYAMNQLFHGGFAFFDAFAQFLGDGTKPKVSLKEAYQLLLDFLLLNGGGEKARHLIKWDILAHDEKAVMPKGITHQRHKETEFRYQNNRSLVNIEYFPYDNTVRVFDIKRRHPVTGELFLIEERVQ